RARTRCRAPWRSTARGTRAFARCRRCAAPTCLSSLASPAPRLGLTPNAGPSASLRRGPGALLAPDDKDHFSILEGMAARGRSGVIHHGDTERFGKTDHAGRGEAQRPRVAPALQPAEVETAAADFRTDVVAPLAPVEARA